MRVARQILQHVLGPAERSEAKKDGALRNVFCFSMGDLMDDEAPEGELERLYSYVNRTDFLRYLFLTKRPENYARRLPV